MLKIKTGLIAAIFLGILIYAPKASAADKFEVSCNSLTISNAGGERKFYVSCDDVWTVTTDADWISVYPASGSAGDNLTIVLTVKPNTAEGDRKATVSFTTKGKTADIPLNQVNVSTDNYWLDGDLIPAHLHRKVSDGGTMPNDYKPVCILLIGNGWDLSDNKKGGLYEQFVNGWANLFLQQDIFKDMQDYFDIYAYVSESNQRGNIPYSAYKYEIDGHRDMDKLGSDATFALLKIRHPNAKSAVNVDITNGSVGGWNFYFSNRAGGSGQYAAFGNPQGEQWGQYWWTHEFMGHDFSNMPDYYYHNGGIDTTKNLIPYTEIPFVANGKNWTFKREGKYPSCYQNGACDVYTAIKSLVRDWDNGFWWTTDWESNPEKVIWKTFIGRNGYDNVKVFNGGNLNGIDHYKRPEDHNVMNENWGAHCGANIWHDVGSRLWIWSKVYERAGVTSAHLLVEGTDPTHPRSLENFIHFDTINGYNANGKRVCNYPTPEVLTATYWTKNKLFPADQDAYRDWIPECTVVTSGGNRILKDGSKTLKEGTDYTVENLGDNFVLYKGAGIYSGKLKYKVGTGLEFKYAGNGGTVCNLPEDNTLYTSGAVVTIPFGDKKPTWEGCTFLGYAGSSTAAAPEFTENGTKTVTITRDTVLYGVWETTVQFDTNGADAPIPSVITIVGQKITAPVTPTKEGSVFLGWYADANFKTVWDFETKPVTDATTIYAKWVAKSSGDYINLEDPTETVTGTNWSLNNSVYTITDGADVRITGANNARNIVVTSGATVTLTLEDVTIEPSAGKNATPINVTGANVTLKLKGTNTLTASPSTTHAAIEQNSSGSLTINNAEATAGVLYATGGKFSAGIGGQQNKGCGTILINGGVIFASSDPTENAASHGAAIGGGRYGKGGDITINGGTVSAVGKKPGVAIGNGETGSVNTITINGGTVYASAANARPIGNGNATGEGVKIGGNAIVFMTSNSQPFVGIIEPSATVREEIEEEGASFLTVTQNSVDIKIEDPGLTVPENAILGVPTGSTLFVGIGVALNNYGRVLAGSINNVDLADGEPYGNILGWENGVRGNINTAIRQTATVPARVYLEGEFIRIEAENVTGAAVYSISGQIVSSVTGAITSLPAPSAKGIYIVRVATANGIIAKKIVRY